MAKKQQWIEDKLDCASLRKINRIPDSWKYNSDYNTALQIYRLLYPDAELIQGHELSSEQGLRQIFPVAVKIYDYINSNYSDISQRLKKENTDQVPSGLEQIASDETENTKPTQLSLGLKTRYDPTSHLNEYGKRKK